jgi:pimeloyl-ACP methyl ester carboxylesterase
MKNKKQKTVSKVKKVFKIIGLVILGLIIAGLIFEQIAEFIDKKTLKAPGQMIQVGDHKMHIYCTGENKNGSPTVILEAGGGNIWATWSSVQPEISKYTKVCSYDRSGYGFSEGSKDNRTNIEVVQELEQLLTNANIKGPYVLAGHSIGGYYIRVFASRHMNEVKGLVFIDSSHENQGELMDQKISTTDKIMGKVMEGVIYFAIKTGVARLVITADPGYIGMPKENLSYNRGFLLLSGGSSRTNKVDDMEGAFGSTDQVKAVRNLGNIPIRVLTADSSIAGSGDMDWLGWQKDIASLSTNGKQMTVANTSHFIQVDQPQTVIDQILELIK